MKDKRLLQTFEFSFQATQMAQQLESAGIEYELRPRVREYASVVAGGSNNAVDLFVRLEQFTKAKSVLDQAYKDLKQEADSDHQEEIPRNYFKRVLIFSCLGIIFLPVIFNLAATQNFFQLRKQPASGTKLMIASAFLIGGWIGAFAFLSLFIPGFNIYP